MKLSVFLAAHHIDAAFFQNGGKINFGLWYKEAKYSVLIEQFGKNRIAASLLEDDRSFYNPVFKYNSFQRTIVMDFNRFIQEWTRLEDEVFPNLKIEMWRKPFVIWERLETLV